MLLADEHDVGTGQIGDHGLEVGERLAAGVVDALGHICGRHSLDVSLRPRRGCALRQRELQEKRGNHLRPIGTSVTPWLALAEIDRLRFRAETQVDHLHEHRKAHGEVDVALFQVMPEAFEEQRYADEQQEAERQHLTVGCLWTNA